MSVEGNVGLVVNADRLLVELSPRPRDTLDALLAQCDTDADLTPQEREWPDAPAVGRENI